MCEGKNGTGVLKLDFLTDLVNVLDQRVKGRTEELIVEPHELVYIKIIIKK